MMKTAFVFSGQGDQFPGMGKELYERYESSRRVFEVCDRLRPGTSGQCFDGTEEDLKETGTTQPCLYAMEMAAAAAMQEIGIRPDAAGGFSLGELAAAAMSGLTDPETGFRLVTARGKLMQKAADAHDTGMVAVLKLSGEQVSEICARFHSVEPVNFNCPGQITAAGMADELAEFGAAVKAAGGRAVPLKVKGAFHSPFMRSAAEGFAQILNTVRFGEMKIPLYSDVTGEKYTGNYAKLLSDQIMSPVQWERLVRNMIRDGIDTFIEIGPGKTLTNMIRRIDPEVTAEHYSEVIGRVGRNSDVKR